jgi:hypothetical protein
MGTHEAMRTNLTQVFSCLVISDERFCLRLDLSLVCVAVYGKPPSMSVCLLTFRSSASSCSDQFLYFLFYFYQFDGERLNETDTPERLEMVR